MFSIAVNTSRLKSLPSVINSVFAVGINREEFEPWFGGFRNGTSCVLTASLASHASTSLIVSNNSSIFHTSLVDFHALFSRISLESLDIMIGINRLPHSWDDTPREERPCTCTLNLS